MKKNHKNIILSMALAVPLCMALPGCSAIDDDYSSCGESRLRASIGSGGSRATALESSWEENDQVALQRTDAAEVFAYRVVDPATGTLTPVSISSVVDLSVAGSLRGWSYGGTYGAALPTRWSAAADQSTLANFQQSDVLLAQATTINTAADAVTTLNFQHMTARVRTTFANGEGGIVFARQVKTQKVINVSNQGTLSDEGAWTITNENPSSLVSYPLPDDERDAELLADRSTLVLPQYVQNRPFLEIQIVSADELSVTTYRYTPAAGKANLVAGYQHLYRITFAAEELVIEVVQANPWEEVATEGEIISTLAIPLYADVTDWTKVTGEDGSILESSLTINTPLAEWSSTGEDGSIISAVLHFNEVGVALWNYLSDGNILNCPAYSSNPSVTGWLGTSEGSIGTDIKNGVVYPGVWTGGDNSDLDETTAHENDPTADGWGSNTDGSVGSDVKDGANTSTDGWDGGDESNLDETKAHENSTGTNSWTGESDSNVGTTSAHQNTTSNSTWSSSVSEGTIEEGTPTP